MNQWEQFFGDWGQNYQNVPFVGLCSGTYSCLPYPNEQQMGGSAFFDESTGTNKRFQNLALGGIALVAGLLIFRK